MTKNVSAQARDAALRVVPPPVGEDARASLSAARSMFFAELAAELGLPDDYSLPAPYEIDRDGVHDTARGKVTSAPLLLTQAFIDPEGLQMVEVAWRDRGRWIRRTVARSVMVSGKALVTALADAGLPVIASASAPAERYLAALETHNRGCLRPQPVARWLGWQRDGAFVTAQGQPRKVEPTYPEQAAWLAAHRPGGTFDGWQRAVAGLREYPVAQMVLCAAFAPVLLDVLQLDSHTIDVSGRSTRGKTTSAKIALSAWADPSERADGIFSWRTTAIAVEKRLNLVRGLPVVLDETRVVKSPELVDQVLYQVPKNHGQARGGGWPSLLPWQTVVISTGEQSALSFTQHQGASARVLSVMRPPFPSGGTAGDDVRAVDRGVSEHFGHAGPAFVDHLQRVLKQEGGAAGIRDRHERLSKALAGENDLATRRAPALAAHLLAGQLAHEWAVLPDPPPEVSVWLDVFQAEEETDDRGEMALNVVREFVASNSHALWAPGVHRAPPPGGWIGRLYDYEGQTTVALLPQRLRDVLTRAGGGGFTLDAVLNLWEEAGVLLKLGGPQDRTPYLAPRALGGTKVRMLFFAPGRIEYTDQDASRADD